MSTSASADWWLNSGGRLHVSGGLATTNLGELRIDDPWRILYAASSPTDTDLGYHPQNLFRLVTRRRWQTFRQELSFRIRSTNLSSSPERNAWSGILLFHRYQDGANLYYAGIRADGAAVIKKKQYGKYFTLAYRKIYPGTYDRVSNPSLLPHDRTVRLRTVIEDIPGGGVRIRVELLDSSLGQGWQSVLEAEDLPGGEDGDPIIAPGFTGIRTDFMDVAFQDFTVVAASGSSNQILATPAAPGFAPNVVGFDALGVPAMEFRSYGPRFLGGVRLARCDTDGDGQNEIVTAPGPGGSPRIRILSVANGGPPIEIATWNAYEPWFRGGVFIACADVDGDGRDEVVTGAGSDRAPLVRIFAVGNGRARERARFLAYGAGFRNGVRVAACDLDGNGRSEVVTGPALGGGGLVRWFDASGESGARPLGALFAAARGFRGGIAVACGDVAGDGRAAVITVPASEGAPFVGIFEIKGSSARSIAAFLADDRPAAADARVAACDLDGDGVAEIVTAAGAGGNGEIRTFSALGSMRGLARFHALHSGGTEVACGPAS